MTPNESVLNLLLEWEERAAEGDEVAAEVLCRSCPDQLNELRRCIGLLRFVSPLLDSGGVVADEVELPTIPGYEILCRLGRGGMGVVYRAWDPVLERDVAIKVPQLGVFTSQSAKARFNHEARVLAQLRHPNIVPLHVADLSEGRPYFVMDYVPQGSLADHLERLAAQPKRVVALIQQVARAVDHAHKHGVLHRDLKPSNILLDEHDHPLVCDFGLAALLSASGAVVVEALGIVGREQGDAQARPRLTRIGMAMGTPAYRAPEQAGGRDAEVGPAADVYALGVILYEALAGKLPYPDAAEDNPTQRRSHEIPSLRPVGASRDLDAVCRKCLAQDPQQRYPSAVELADDLRAVQAGLPIQGASLARRVWVWLRRHPATAAAVLFACTALAALALSVTPPIFQLPAGSEAAHESLNHALSLLQQGDVPLGLHRLVSSLELTPAEDRDLQRVIRTNLAGWSQCLCVLKDIYPQTGPVLSLVPNHNGSAVLIGVCSPDTQSGEAILLDAETGKQLGAPLRHGSPVWTVACRPDGELFATGGEDGRVRLWRADTRQPVEPPFRHPKRVVGAAFLPDGKTLVTASLDGTVKRWDSRANKQLGADFRVKWVIRAMALSQDGKRILLGGSRSADKMKKDQITGWAQIWDLEKGQPTPPLLAHPSLVQAVAFHPDGKRVLTGSSDTKARLWDTSTGDRMEFDHRDPVQAVAFRSDGQIVFIGTGENSVSQGIGQLWDISTGKQVGTALTHQGMVRAGVFSQDGERLFSASSDRMVKRWGLSLGVKAERIFPHPDVVKAVAFSSNRATIATAGWDHTIRLWDVETGRCKGAPLQHTDQVYAVVFSPSGRRVAAGSSDGTVQIWDAETGQKLGPPLQHPKRNWILALAFSPDGSRLATVGTEDSIFLWQVDDGSSKGLVWWHQTKSVKAITFSWGGTRLMTVGSDGMVREWDVQTGREVRKGMSLQTAVRVAAFSPDRKSLVTCGDDNRAQRWDVSSGAPLGLPFVHKGQVISVGFNPAGTVLVTGCDDGTAHFWDMTTGHRLGPPLQQGKTTIRSVVFHPDGGRVLTGIDTGATLWRCARSAEGDIPQLWLQVQVATGVELKKSEVEILDASEWLERRQRLEAMQGRSGS